MYLGKNEWVLNFPYQTLLVCKANKESYLVEDQQSLESSNSAKRKLCLRLTKCSVPRSHTQSTLERGWLLWSAFHSSLIYFLWPPIFSSQILLFPFLWETSSIFRVLCKDSAFGYVPMGAFLQLNWEILKEKRKLRPWGVSNREINMKPHVVESWFITDI